MGILRKKITEKDVVNYLLENSDFFIKNPQALEALEIKHESGDAVSLIERQVELIKEKSNKTVSKLKELLSNAHLNETLFIKVKDLVKIILNSRQLEDLSSGTENFFKNEFETDACKVIFFTQEDLFGFIISTNIFCHKSEDKFLSTLKAIFLLKLILNILKSK